MDTVHVTFKVEVSKSRHCWNHDEIGDTELEFDIPVSILTSINLGDLLVSLLPIAYNNYLEKDRKENGD